MKQAEKMCESVSEELKPQAIVLATEENQKADASV